jgi:repressor of nif and glnA expression
MTADSADDMTKEERKRVVLQFLEEHPLALTPTLIFRNLKLHRGITFGRRSVDTYLREMTENGLLMRVEPDPLDNGKLVEAEKGKKAYYIITESGRDELRD